MLYCYLNQMELFYIVDLKAIKVWNIEINELIATLELVTVKN